MWKPSPAPILRTAVHHTGPGGNGARIRLLPVTSTDASSSAEAKIASEFDFLFLRGTSSMEKVDGKLVYKCASCLRHYSSLGPLQRHIALGWKEGFSCRVFYKKLKEMRARAEEEGLQDTWPAFANGSPDFAEAERRNNFIIKWLSGIPVDCRPEITETVT